MTLTQAATLTKRGVITTLVIIFLGITAALSYNIWHQYYLAHLPLVEEKPEMKFGSLPKLNFPQSNVSSSNFSYSLDTVTGGLPQTPKLLKIYFLPRSGVSLLAPEKAKILAQSLGFPFGPEIISSSQYNFSDGEGGKISIDLTTGNFHFQKLAKQNLATGSAVLKGNFSDQPKLVADFKNYLASKTLLPEELQNGRSNVTFNSQFENPQTATISLWPTDLDSLPIITSNPRQGLVGGTLTSAEEEKDKFVRVDYTFWLIDNTTSSTYHLKTAEQAFADLRSGLGFISLEPKKPQVSISSVYLAYFESEEYSPYLQPVFVFEGPDFAGIVPAVSGGSK